MGTMSTSKSSTSVIITTETATCSLPILYSLRNCPFAMRARMAIYKAQISVELRDLVLSNKPVEMLNASPKGTVPVVVLSTGSVIEESLDVMLWALTENDPHNLLRDTEPLNNTISLVNKSDIVELVTKYDQQFKPCLEAYKCAKRYHESNLIECREACEIYIQELEQGLAKHRFILDNQESMADIALLPFIRQFAKVERSWYLSSRYVNVRRWLNAYLQSAVFNKVMTKYPLWQAGQEPEVFGYKIK